MLKVVHRRHLQQPRRLQILITHPATTTHRAWDPTVCGHRPPDSVVRLSVGLEGTADLLSDLDKALG